MDIQTAINRIKYYAFAEKGWSQNQLAKAAGISFSAVEHIHDMKLWNPTLKVLRALEAVVPEGFSLASLTTNLQTHIKEIDHDER